MSRRYEPGEVRMTQSQAARPLSSAKQVKRVELQIACLTPFVLYYSILWFARHGRTRLYRGLAANVNEVKPDPFRRVSFSTSQHYQRFSCRHRPSLLASAAEFLPRKLARSLGRTQWFRSSSDSMLFLHIDAPRSDALRPREDSSPPLLRGCSAAGHPPRERQDAEGSRERRPPEKEMLKF